MHAFDTCFGSCDLPQINSPDRLFDTPTLEDNKARLNVTHKGGDARSKSDGYLDAMRCLWLALFSRDLRSQDFV